MDNNSHQFPHDSPLPPSRSRSSNPSHHPVNSNAPPAAAAPTHVPGTHSTGEPRRGLLTASSHPISVSSSPTNAAFAAARQQALQNAQQQQQQVPPNPLGGGSLVHQRLVGGAGVVSAGAAAAASAGGLFSSARVQQQQQQPSSSNQAAQWSVPNPLGGASLSQTPTSQLQQQFLSNRASGGVSSHHHANQQQQQQVTTAAQRVQQVVQQQQQVKQQQRQVLQQQQLVASASASLQQQQQQLQQQQRAQAQLQQQQQAQAQRLQHQQHQHQHAQQQLQPQASLPVQQVHQAQQQQAAAAAASALQKKTTKVILTPEAKHALAKAIWSAIRSPTGTVDATLMERALQTGLPRHAILNAARVAREREAAKRQQKQQELMASQNSSTTTSISASAMPPSSSATVTVMVNQQQQQQAVPAPSSYHQSSSAAATAANLALAQQQLQQQQKQQLLRQQQQQLRQQQQQLQQAKESSARQQERMQWKRVQHGIFTTQKGRFLAVTNSVGAMVRCKHGAPVIVQKKPSRKRPRSESSAIVMEEAALLQAQLRAQAQQATSLNLFDPSRFKRIKIEPKKYVKALDRFARKSRQSAAEVLSKQHKEWTKSIASHQQEFVKFHRARKLEAFKLAKVIRDTFDKEEKKKEKDAVQAERARLAALKANDMTAYSQLLEETRNDRLKFLLEKTEKHFTKISALLQQRGDDAEDAAAAGDAGNNMSYYTSAHKKNEEVRQPSLLIGGDLKEYQLTGLQWLVSLYNNNLNGILADEMGLGKTIQAISLLTYLMEYKQNLGPFLVIVPLSTLSNWQNEFSKWCPSVRTVCYKGTPNQRKEIYKDQIHSGHFNVVLTTYEYIIKDKKYLRKIEWQYAIVDEGHRMKNANSKFAVTLGTQYVTKFRVLLTGTPLMNDLSELWSLLNFLLPTIFNSVETFDQWFSAPFSQFTSSSSTGEGEGDQLLTNEERILVIHRLHELLRPFMLRRVKSEVLDQLPEKIEKVLRCDLSSWQKELYKQISFKAVADNGLLGAAPDSQVPTRGLNNVVMQLRKVCNHPYLFTPEGYHINDKLIRSSGKFALLDQMLPKLKMAGHRVLMFTQMTAVMTILEDYFAYRGYLSLRLDGSTPAEEREKRMYKFNSPDSPYFIFLLSTRAGGLGLNLTAADTVIILDSDWNPMMDLQAQDRAHRIGQRSDVSVFRLITNSPVEEKILSRATEKLNVSELVVESGQFNKESVDNDNSLERRRLMEVLLTDFNTQSNKGPSEKSGSDGGDDDDDNSGGSSEDVEDLNELLSNNEADYQLYADFDKRREEMGLGCPALYVSEDDVPNWILHPQPAGSKGSLTPVSNTGARKRKDVMYDDGLTEKQFLRLMEKQAVDEERQTKKQKRGRGGGAAAKAAALSPSLDEEVDDDFDDADAPMEVSTSSALTDWTFRKLISCTKSVVALKDPSTKRRISEIFLEKPDRATFPDYYEIIDKPIAINDILRKCRAKLYVNLPEFKDDWNLMFMNARKFNGETSWVVDDAKALEKELERVLKKNGFSDGSIPIGKKKKLRIKLSLKDVR